MTATPITSDAIEIVGDGELTDEAITALAVLLVDYELRVNTESQEGAA